MHARPSYTVDAIILKRRATGEADRVITLFTKQYGKMRVLAKGVRRVTSRRGPHVEPAAYVRCVLHQGKGGKTLSEVETVEAFTAIRENLALLSYTYYILELVEKLLPEAQVHRDTFDLLVETLTKLNTRETDVRRITVYFCRTLLVQLGFLSHEKRLSPGELPQFIETILERRLTTPPILRRLMGGLVE